MVYTHGRLRSTTPHQDGGFVLDLGLHFNWTEQPSDQFRAAAAAGIIVLLAMLLVLNASAIIIRQRFSRRLQG